MHISPPCCCYLPLRPTIYHTAVEHTQPIFLINQSPNSEPQSLSASLAISRFSEARMFITALTRNHNKHAYEGDVLNIHPSTIFLLFTLTLQLYLILPRHFLPPFAFLIKFSWAFVRLPISDTYIRNKFLAKFLTSAAFGAGWITTAPNIQYFLVITNPKQRKNLTTIIFIIFWCT